jgi:quinol monooxygenase YgiN
MPRITTVRYRVKPGREAENAALSRAVFEELRRNPAPHVAYALFRDGQEFLHVFMNTAEDDSASVTELPVFKRFSEGLPERQEAPPEVTRSAMTLVDSYGLSSVPEPA